MLARSLAAVNSLLMLHADVPLPLAKLAQLTEQPYAVTASALKTLEKRGLVVRTTRAGQDEFAPNRQSTYYPVAYLLALVDLPISHPLAGHKVYAAYAYGSLSRPGGGHPGSDLDLLLVLRFREEEARETMASQLAVYLNGRLHRPIDPWVLTLREAENLIRQQDPHIVEALKGVRIMGGLE
jgi:predicted nucleotidyltransferase